MCKTFGLIVGNKKKIVDKKNHFIVTAPPIQKVIYQNHHFVRAVVVNRIAGRKNAQKFVPRDKFQQIHTSLKV